MRETNCLKERIEIPLASLLIDSRVINVNVPPETAFEPIRRIGGATGWYYGDWLWRLRGWLDRLVGGIGFRQGRRHPVQLAVGDIVDCMRVEAYEPGRRLLLTLEMRVPGCAWLEFEVEGNSSGSTIRQTALFEPAGLIGRAYWYLIYPFHQVVFAGMLRSIAARGEASDMYQPEASLT